jgi:predicted O-methyltransferase YrrM
MDERFLSTISGAPLSAVRNYLQEPFRDPEFSQALRNAEIDLPRGEHASAAIYGKKVLLQYVVARAMRPGIIVETGVANGVSCAYLLLALKLNQKGTLHSVEIGDSSYLPPGRESGWVVPDWLRDRWQLHIGDSRSLLPELLRQLGTIDLFIHDSLHTADHMKFEFECAYPYLREDGVLVADDAIWNSAFHDFASAVYASHARILRGVGILRKRHS